MVLFQVLLHSATVSTNFSGKNIRWKGPPEPFFKNWYPNSQSFKWKVMHTKISNLAISPLASCRLPGYIMLRLCGLSVPLGLLLHHWFQVHLLQNSPVEFPLALIWYNNFQFLAKHLPCKFYVFLHLLLERETTDTKDHVGSLQCLKSWFMDVIRKSDIHGGISAVNHWLSGFAAIKALGVAILMDFKLC